mmetsp:Transcript_17192/g.25458  ORF Transcript_17192/g.25458 Transcript_17192/m.25458 type:complete len:164 (-) Transcript_17192:28-519(-)
MSTHGTAGFGESYVPNVVAESSFRFLDKNGDNVLDENEIEELVSEQLGLEKDRTEAALLLIDKDASGDIDIEEFKKWLRSKEMISVLTDDGKYEVLCEAIKLFKEYDLDKSGYLCPKEFRIVMNALNAIGNGVTVDSAFKGLDEDGNGKISFFEFFQWLNWIE